MNSSHSVRHCVAWTAAVTLLVSDLTANVVWECDLVSGDFLRLFAPAGGADTTILNSVPGIALRDRYLLATSGSPTNDNAVAMFDVGGAYLGNFVANCAGGLNSPWDVVEVTVGAGGLTAGQWLVSGSDSDAIHRYDGDGVAMANFAAGWQARADLPTPSSGVPGCDEERAFGFDTGAPWELAGRIVLAGCGQWESTGAGVLADSFLYNVAADTWAPFPALTAARRNHAAVFVTDSSEWGRMWVGGGYVEGSANTGTDTVETFLVQAALFVDGFETGTTAAWSTVMP